MKNIHILIAAAVLFLASSCTPERFDLQPDGQYISFSVSAPAMATKADAPGEDRYNENTIKSIYYFFYPEASDDVAPVLNGSYSGLNITSGTKQWTLSISQDAVNRLFPTGYNKCRLFVVANPPQDIISDLRSAPTYDDLKQISFSTGLDGIQDSFVMIYNELVEIGQRTAATVMTVDAGLKRIANKLTFKVYIKKSHVDSEFNAVTWETQPDGLRVAFVNGMSKTNLSGDFSLFSDNDVEDSYFESSHVDFTFVDYDADNYLATVKLPLYSYPMIWDFEDVHEPYFLFELPVISSTGKYQTCYYKYMLSEKRMTSNRWYDITANLNVLGSFFRNEPSQGYLRQSYLVLDWNEAYANPGEPEHNVEADIETSRYLVFNEDYYEIYDQESLDIPFLSSHFLETDANGYIPGSSVTVAEKPNYGGSSSSTNYSKDKGKLFKVSGSVLTFNNKLNNTLNNTLDCTPWTFTVTVKHSDDSKYYKTITVKQYPSIYIKTEANSAGRNVSGNVYVNGSSSENGYYGGVHAANTSGNNSSTDMTIISVGRLGKDSEFTIGDPRDFASTWSTTWSATANGIRSKTDNATSNRKLTYYYPTLEDEGHRKYIAPKFRTSSANGQLGNAGWFTRTSISYSDAKRRCASYQEDGYPAGRWRLPTFGEVKFIINLSANGFIPAMFYNNQDYWCAGGYASVEGATATFQNSTSGNHYVRCVYDEWYWEQIDKNLGIDHSTKTFYWGDVQY